MVFDVLNMTKLRAIDPPSSTHPVCSIVRDPLVNNTIIFGQQVFI